MRKHLESCAECRATTALLQRTVTTVVALPAFQPSLGLRRRVLTRVEALPRPWAERFRDWFRPTVLLPSGVGVALAAVLAFVAVRHAADQRRLELAVASNYELLSDYGLRSLSKAHEKNQFEFSGRTVGYEAAEAVSKIKGG